MKISAIVLNLLPSKEKENVKATTHFMMEKC